METQYDFDKIIDCNHVNAIRTTILKEHYGRTDLLPLWVADMEFETPDFITDALRQRLDCSWFGYIAEPPSYRRSILNWLQESHGWEVNDSWLTYIPGIVKGIGMALNVFSEPGDKIIIQPPVYHPFRLTTIGNGRQVVYNPLKRNPEGHFEMDFEQLEKIIDGCKMLVLANPHNPGGRVWSRDTLSRLADLCAAHKVIVISDEIHSDLMLYGNRHTPFAMVSDAAAQNSITFGAPSKTFNMAGIVSSFAIVPNDTLRRKFFHWLDVNEFNAPTFFATLATEAAYTHGRAWMKQMLAYIEGNIDFTANYLQQHIPQIKAIKPEASFLIWLDCSELQLSHESLNDLFINKAHLALNDGEMFGPGGEGHMRLNAGCPRSQLLKALEQLKQAVQNL